MNILISAIAGDIGFGAGRILRRWGWVGELHGIDLHNLHPGSLIFDKVAVAPPASDPTYLEWLGDYVAENNIALFLPTSEAEIAFFGANEVSAINRTQVLVNGPESVNLSLDKLECMSFLAMKGLPVPDNGLVGETDPNAFPVIVKPRFGSGGRGVKLLNSRAEYKQQATAGEVWQKYLSPESEEYTCAIYRSKTCRTRSLILRRELLHGMTSRGEVVVNDDITDYLLQIAEFLNVNGAVNVQLRLTHQGPRLFEINPRLSSTLVFRDKMGFQDLRWWIADSLSPSNTPSVPNLTGPPAGTLFFRGAKEYILGSKD